MKRVLLDTSAYSALLRAHRSVVEIVQRARTIVLTPVVLGELEAGFQRGSRLERNRRQRDELLASPRVSVVVIDDETALRYGLILSDLRRRGRPVPTNDIWIAASAMQHGLIVITTDTHFEQIPQVSAVVLPVRCTPAEE